MLLLWKVDEISDCIQTGGGGRRLQYGTHDGLDALRRNGRLRCLDDLLVGRVADPGGAQQPIDDAATQPLRARLQIEHLVEQVQGGRQRRIVPGVLRTRARARTNRFNYIGVEIAPNV